MPEKGGCRAGAGREKPGKEERKKGRKRERGREGGSATVKTSWPQPELQPKQEREASGAKKGKEERRRERGEREEEE